MQDKITAYITQQEPWKQQVLKKLRGAMHNADPEIHESIKWGTPAFEHKGLVTWVFCASEWVHLSFQQGALLDASHNMWEEGPDTASQAKRTIKFREGDEVPVELIEHLVHEAVDNNIEGRRVEFHITKPGSKEFDVPAEYAAILRDHNAYELYENRPYYQQKGWIQWIEGAKRDETKQKRIEEMLLELEEGTYMPRKRSGQ
ncbi:MAG: hypothetical protein JWP13_174 [Candidatus Saccharibacteria bacterium]|nr:hypothetical protein [Candidatus Saccharibacteria bacterium]